jgi:hypothetical protein
MGVRADLWAMATFRNMHLKLRPKTFPVSIKVFITVGAVVIGMVEEVDEPFTFVILDVCND